LTVEDRTLNVDRISFAGSCASMFPSIVSLEVHARHEASVGISRSYIMSRQRDASTKSRIITNSTMHDGEDPGDVFAIPDLWASSKYFPDNQDGCSFLFSQLKFDGKTSP